MKLIRNILMAVLLLSALNPSPLFACAACYGKSDAPMAQGMNYGIFTLLAVVLCVLTVFLLCFVHIVRKGEAMHRDAVKRMEEL